MSIVTILIIVIVLTSAGFGCLLAWLFARQGLAGAPLKERLNRLEAEVMRLRDQRTRPASDPDLAGEVHPLEEKVDFLENLLADRPKPGALPSADREGFSPDR